MRWRSIGTASAAIAAAAGLGIGGAALATAKEEPVTSVNGYGSAGQPDAAPKDLPGVSGTPGEQGDLPATGGCTGSTESGQPGAPPAT